VALRLRFAALALLPVALAACGTSADDEAPGDEGTDHLIGHVHGLGVNPADDALYVAGHNGVFRIEDGSPIRVADRWQDTMAFTIAGPDTFLASGHPDLREDLPPHLGLIESTDAAETWKPLSLQGEADFHAIEIVGDRIYGYDATGGQLMTTTDRETWKPVTTGQYIDLATLPSQTESVLATTPTGAVDEIRLDGTQRPLAGAPELVLIDSTPQGRIVGVTAGGELYSTSRLGDPWEHAGQVPGTPAALAADDGAWHVATDEAILSSTDDGATWGERRGLTPSDGPRLRASEQPHPIGWSSSRFTGVGPVACAGKRSRFRRSALTATRKLEPDIDSAATSGRSTRPKAGSKTPAAIGSAMAL
jgi:hypothetical protein